MASFADAEPAAPLSAHHSADPPRITSRTAATPDLPDAMFVEDPAVVLDELAVILSLERKPAAVRRLHSLKRSPNFDSSNTFLFLAHSKVVTSSVSAESSLSASPDAATPKA